MEKYISSAVAHFEQLLRQQLSREEQMAQDGGAVDFTSKKTIRIGIVGGDGIGPVIVKQAKRLIEKLLAEEIAIGKIELVNIEGLTLENRMAQNKSLPDEVLTRIRSCDVLLKGPTTTPKGGTMESANVSLRRELDLYANVRPVLIESEGIDWTFFRENTEGEYVLGSSGIELPGKLCMDFKVTTLHGTERIARAAMDYARKNGKTKVAIVTKANIMKKTDGSFSEIAHRIGETEYPELELEDWYIDIMTANLVNTEIRSGFQVFLLPNLYGDIITDEAAQIQGGVGTAGSANIGDKYAMFEAIHGSAPRMIEAGEGEYANPASIFKALELLLRHIAMADKADRLLSALSAEGAPEMTGHANGATCTEYTDFIIGKL